MDYTPNLIFRLSPLVEPLHDGFGLARLRVDRLRVASGPSKQWLRTALFRSEVFNFLDANPVDGWSLDDQAHSQNGAIHLIHEDKDLALRVLREAPTKGGVPCAGSSKQRRAYFCNRPYAQLGLWGELDGISHRLLALWNEPDADDERVALRVVRPVGPGTALRGVPIDMSVDLPRSRTDFERLRFDILDEQLKDNVNIEDEEEGSGGDA